MSNKHLKLSKSKMKLQILQQEKTQPRGLPGGAQTIKNPPAVQETQVQSLGWEDLPGKGNDNQLQYSCLENTMDRGAWQTTVHGVAKGHTRLRD